MPTSLFESDRLDGGLIAREPEGVAGEHLPAALVAAVRRCLGGLDGFYGHGTGQLDQNWRGRVLLHPMVGTPGAWIQRLALLYDHHGVKSAIAVLRAATDTVWFQQTGDWPRCYVRGRLRLPGRGGDAPSPSLLLYLGAHPEVFSEIFSSWGRVEPQMPKRQADPAEIGFFQKIGRSVDRMSRFWHATC